MFKKVAWFSFSIAILGLIAQLSALFGGYPPDWNRTLFEIRDFANALSLGYFGIGLEQYRNFETSQQLSYLTTTAYALLLVGAILYVRSKGKEVRLIRFILSIIFLSNVASMTATASWPIRIANTYLTEWTLITWLTWIVSVAKDALLVYLSYSLLRRLGANRVLVTSTPDTAEITTGTTATTTTTLKEASNWSRFAHLMIDLLVYVFIFSPYLNLVPDGYYKLEKQIGEQLALYAFLFVARMLYYPITEILFQASPAKFLTESRVLDENGQIASRLAIFKRTLLRFIPFEPLTFFESGKRGFHDRFSYTQVVSEERTGVKGQWYLLIFPAMLLVGLGSYFIHEAYEDYEHYTYYKRRHAEKNASIQNALNHITTKHIFKLEDLDNEYGPVVYLVVDEVKGDHIMASVIPDNDRYATSLLRIERIYNQDKQGGIQQSVSLALADLHKGYTLDYDDWDDHKRNAVMLPNDPRKFEIVNVDQLFGPSIHDRATGSYGHNGISMDLLNYGWPAQIISVETLEGSFKCSDELPKQIPTVGRQNDYPTFTINSATYERGEHYKLKIILQDSLNHRHTYLIEGHNMNKTVTRVD